MEKMVFSYLCLILAATCQARIITVDNDGPADFNNIQAAIDANDTKDGDRILVYPGEYDINEPITFRGKNITLKSEDSPKNTIINGNYQTNIFIFNSGETNEAVLERFTITKGRSYDEGGGIYCEGSSPIIRYNTITENEAGYGGGIACLKANPLIESNVISKNIGYEQGGGIYCRDSRALILNNIIKGNVVWDTGGGGIICWGDSSLIIRGNHIIGNYAPESDGGIGYIASPGSSSFAIIENNIIAGNKTNEFGGGIYFSGNGLIIGNTIIQNFASHGGGGIFGHFGDNLVLFNNIVYANTPTDLSGIQPPQVFYSDINQEGFAGINGNISAEPLLVNPNPDPNTLDELINDGDFDGAMKYLRKCYSLQQESPCIDAGDPEYFDPDGTRADIGAIYFDQRTCNRSDLYYDGFINFLDYAKLANSWLKTYPGLEGDIYIDNKVDYKDLEILAENWLYSCD